ncbi:TPM domain-containing protein [Mycobacterium intermedium]|nr:TPM domain-containing protein [Mycobacterium intermedium]
MGGRDALLAIATNTRKYVFSEPPQLQGFTADELNSLRGNKIEPAVNVKDWVGAAVAAADGLNKAVGSSKPADSPKRNWLPIAIGVAVAVLVVLVIVILYRRRRRRGAVAGTADARTAIDGRDLSLGQALSIADTRLRQVSDYIGRHHPSIGSSAQARYDDARRHLAAAHASQSSNADEAIAYANRASTLAAEAQGLANDDVSAAHGKRSRRNSSSKQ